MLLFWTSRHFFYKKETSRNCNFCIRVIVWCWVCRLCFAHGNNKNSMAIKLNHLFLMLSNTLWTHLSIKMCVCKLFCKSSRFVVWILLLSCIGLAQQTGVWITPWAWHLEHVFFYCLDFELIFTLDCVLWCVWRGCAKSLNVTTALLLKMKIRCHMTTSNNNYSLCY